MRSLLLALAATLAIAVALPSAASAAKGWKLPTLSDEIRGLKTTSGAKHCGKSKFGTWKFRGTMRAEGQVARLRWKLEVTKDGTPHPYTGISVTGTAPESVKSQIADSMRAQRVRYVPGSPPQLEALAAQGQPATRREFRPTRTRRC